MTWTPEVLKIVSVSFLKLIRFRSESKPRQSVPFKKHTDYYDSTWKIIHWKGFITYRERIGRPSNTLKIHPVLLQYYKFLCKSRVRRPCNMFSF